MASLTKYHFESYLLVFTSDVYFPCLSALMQRAKYSWQQKMSSAVNNPNLQNWNKKISPTKKTFTLFAVLTLLTLLKVNVTVAFSSLSAWALSLPYTKI